MLSLQKTQKPQPHTLKKRNIEDSIFLSETLYHNIFIQFVIINIQATDKCI